ncbi:S8 family peptidase [Nocardiopsis changdeensis]|uniref:S8 family peptidase n=1 Tax=Nocardiopsis changdeensis TaxID=2831969 RepID=A0ABX8BNI4_9ACTN|nr:MULTISPECIES: S8 family peptidase [Nocardiopsis]QUX23649.1 S8 family peptidase [Nocardiopsis changdeensis]QYX39592.1 S8 family peptidase [Nocardiopsis sp. MT53]
MHKHHPRRAVIGFVAAGALSVPLALSGAVAAGADELAPLYTSTDAVSGEWFVVLEETMGTASVTPSALGIAANDVNHTYEEVFQGYSATLTTAEVQELRAQDGVAYVEQVGVAHTTATWGLDRIDQEDLPLDDSYTTTADGSGVSAYIIDTGIDPDHPDFEGRASSAFDAYGGDGFDGNGHGTHVAGTIGSATYGVAPAADLFGVKVLSDSGSGSYDDVIAGIDWVAANAPDNSVANLSLGGPASQAVDDAVNALADSGVFVAVAAGNEGQDANNVSPARAEGVTTVGASDRNDAAAYFSNHGSPVDLYAPGVAIESTVPGGGVEALSGTSMASPHVAGAAALYKSANGDADQATIQDWLVANGGQDKLSGVPSGTVNILLNVQGL